MKKPNKENMATVYSILGVVGGSIAAKFVGDAVRNYFPNLSPTVKALIPIGAGAFMAMQKNEILKSAGLGMVGAGGVQLAQVFIPSVAAPDMSDLFIDGPASMSILSESDGDILELNGPASMSILSGPADMSILSLPADVMSNDEQLFYRSIQD